MADTTTGEQSIRRAARQAAVAAQARRRAKTAERDKRLDAATLALIVTLRNATAKPPSRKPPASPSWPRPWSPGPDPASAAGDGPLRHGDVHRLRPHRVAGGGGERPARRIAAQARRGGAGRRSGVAGVRADVPKQGIAARAQQIDGEFTLLEGSVIAPGVRVSERYARPP